MIRASSSIAFVLSIAWAAADVTALSAQEGRQSSSKFIPRVSLSGAFDARNNGRGDPEMYLGLASLEWNTRVTGLALRADAIYARRDRITRQEQPCIACDRVGNGYSFFSSKVTAAGGMIGASYDVQARRGVRPYVLVGAGLVRIHDKFASGTASYSCIGLCLASATALPIVRNERPVSGAVQAGVGLAYSWRWLSALAETRYMAADYANTRGLNGAVPVSLGLSIGNRE